MSQRAKLLKSIKQDPAGKFTYDTKAAMHAIRLGLQGLSLARTGTIILPSPHAQLLKFIRDGEFSKEEILLHIDDIESKLRVICEKIPDGSDWGRRDRASSLLVSWHRSHWSSQGLL
jgi:hypothetical protein